MIVSVAGTFFSGVREKAGMSFGDAEGMDGHIT